MTLLMFYLYVLFFLSDNELHMKFQSMKWQDSKVTADFKMALKQSSTMHVCESKRNNTSFVSIAITFRSSELNNDILGTKTTHYNLFESNCKYGLMPSIHYFRIYLTTA